MIENRNAKTERAEAEILLAMVFFFFFRICLIIYFIFIFQFLYYSIFEIYGMLCHRTVTLSSGFDYHEGKSLINHVTRTLAAILMEDEPEKYLCIRLILVTTIRGVLSQLTTWERCTRRYMQQCELIGSKQLIVNFWLQQKILMLVKS